jgi:putative phosphoesterase
MRLLGVLSDTHGLLRPEAIAKLAGVDHLVHAGDIGTPEILDQLREIAPVTAVRGNNDRGAWAKDIPETQLLEMGGRRLYVLHDLSQLDLEPAAGGIAVIIAGHSHRPSAVEKNGVLFLNPGSAGPRRFKLPISVATLRIDATSVRAEIHELRIG